MDTTWRSRLALLAVVGLGAFLRIYELGAESIWLDEAASLGFVTRLTLTEVIFDLPTYETHPPLYYAIFEVWTGIAGVSEVAIRAPSVVFGVLAIPVIYLVGRELYGRRVGLLSAALLGVSRFHIYFAQEARMYSLLALLTLVSFYFLVRLSREWSRRTVAGYLVATVLLGYTHVFGLFVILAQNVFAALVVFKRPSLAAFDLRRWVSLQGPIAIGVSPWLYLLFQRVRSGAGRVSWIQPPSPWMVLDTPFEYFGLTPWTPAWWLGLSCLLVVAGSLAVTLHRQWTAPAERTPQFDTRFTAVLLGSWLLVPVVVPVILSHLVTPIYLPKYTIVASVAAFVLLARGLDRLLENRRTVGAVVTATLVVTAGATLIDYYGNDQKEQWREAAGYVADNANEGDIVLVSQEYVSMPFTYYFDDQNVSVIPVYASASTDRLRTLTADRDTVWMVFSHIGEPDRQRFVAALNDTYTGRNRRRFVGVQVHRFDRGSETA